jgi:hypothetical protein
MKQLLKVLSATVILTSMSIAAWNTADNANPVLPGYFADPSLVYDSSTETFYIYATTDGVYITYSADPTVWYSTDFVNWKMKPITLPSAWPKVELWAPSVIKHPTNGKYYLLYCIGNAVYIAYSSSPLGPWTNAVSGATLYSSGQLTGSSDWVDPQFFVDTNTVYMTFGQSSNMGIAKLAFNASTFLVTIDAADARMTDGVVYKCKRLAGLSNNLEGSCMFKKENRYFITYSNSACENYNVHYAVAASPVGPFTYVNRAVLQRDNTNNILGPGHNSILHYGNNWYICYHRQHYQYVDVKRQICVDRIAFNGDSISIDNQTNTGVSAGTGSIETLVATARAVRETDLAYGKTVLASSESGYKGGTATNQNETFAAIAGFYKASYAVDRNNGTRWAPTTLPGYLIVDLGENYNLGRCETVFELVTKLYKYNISYLAQSEAANITSAQSSMAWHTYADRSANTDSLSPLVDSNKVTARYVKITVNSANLPMLSGQISTIIQTDNADRVSIAEFKVFAAASSSVNYPIEPSHFSSAVHFMHGIVIYDMARSGVVRLRVVNSIGRVVTERRVNATVGRNMIDMKKLGLNQGIYFGELATSAGAIGNVRFVNTAKSPE